MATIRENITLRRFVLVDGITGTYIHGGGVAGVITKFATSEEIAAKAEFADYAKNICMQIAAMLPSYLDPASVPASVIENEKEVLLAQIQNDDNLKNKPDAVKEKMVNGRVNKFYDQNCLLNQAYVKDEGITVAKYTENTAKELGGDIKIVSFVKYERGEGIEKKQEDFAAEIEKLVKG
ncbi:MAG: translation elongation factor Ts [Clostridia bacterium]|nr:translation elongation factor Ts [Clostridia bacterium]